MELGLRPEKTQGFQYKGWSQKELLLLLAKGLLADLWEWQAHWKKQVFFCILPFNSVLFYSGSHKNKNKTIVQVAYAIDIFFLSVLKILRQDKIKVLANLGSPWFADCYFLDVPQLLFFTIGPLFFLQKVIFQTGLLSTSKSTFLATLKPLFPNIITF